MCEKEYNKKSILFASINLFNKLSRLPLVYYTAALIQTRYTCSFSKN